MLTSRRYYAGAVALVMAWIVSRRTPRDPTTPPLPSRRPESGRLGRAGRGTPCHAGDGAGPREPNTGPYVPVRVQAGARPTRGGRSSSCAVPGRRPDRAGDRVGLTRTDHHRPGPRGPGRPALPHVQVPVDGQPRRIAQGGARVRLRRGGAAVQDARRPTAHAGGEAPPPAQPRRAPAAVERGAW